MIKGTFNTEIIMISNSINYAAMYIFADVASNLTKIETRKHRNR